MTPDDAFLQAILEDPDDDTPRLVYADWLDEHGQPERADFIRVQCELAWLKGVERPDSKTQARMAALATREAFLFRSHRDSWSQPLPKWARGWYGFERGFVTTVSALAEEFLQHGADLFRVAPVQHLAVEFAAGRVAALAASPLLTALRSLLLGNQSVDDDASRALAASAHLANLTLLNLDNNQITRSGARELAASPHLQRLVRLQLAGNMLGQEGAVVLAAALSLPSLAVLDLPRNGIGNAGTVALAGAARLAGLNALHLQSNGIGEEGARALAHSPYLGDLQVLSLGNNPINARGVRALQTRFGSRVHL
jgi:uncharacterized protein (TIGR02996 family)